MSPLASEVQRLDNIEKRLESTNARLDQLENRRTFVVRIQTFGPEPFELLHPIEVTVEFDGEDFQASFFDANVNASGCNETEAIENLKENILSRFDYLDLQPPEQLAKPLRKQIAVLREFVARKT